MLTRGQRRLAKTQKINTLASEISTRTHFTTDDCKALLSMHERMSTLGKVDRLRFRELLHCCFGITDDIMLDLTFRAFDRNSDGVVRCNLIENVIKQSANEVCQPLTSHVDENEFIVGLSSMLRGDLNELIDFCYFVYDINGDKSLAREELFQCLKGCINAGFGVDADDLDDAEKDVVEIVMRKLDVNKDGQITFDDFQNAVHADPLLVQSIGPCLPTPENTATFLSTITEHYRAYAGCWTDTVEKEKEKEKARSKRRQSRGEFLGGGQDRENRFTTAARATHAPVGRATHAPAGRATHAPAGRATHAPPGRGTAKSRTIQKETLQPGSVTAKSSSVKKA